MARPKSREGRYERITLEVREDLLGWLDKQQESRREIIEEALIDLKVKKESESMATDTALSATLENFIASDDFMDGVIKATKASWGGSGYSVEIFEDGKWRVLRNNQIGNLYETPGALIQLPILDDDDVSAAESTEAEDEMLMWAFEAERDDLVKELRDRFES